MSEIRKVRTKNTNTLELVFISLIGLAFAAALVAALTYDFVSAQAPLFILVPLLILIGIQFNRIRGSTSSDAVSSGFSNVLKRNHEKFNKATELVGWTVLLLVVIFVAGHYFASATFMYVLLHVRSNETRRLSVVMSISVTAILYLLFEHGFNIELSRGLIFKFFSEYFVG